ncbi:hypothetical protein BTUL_0082g00030 [Botrytis tulipae]|uniref:Uncharacterized protein n=1 Tax=Botrytis tulipae TaxID=87230 RepID=A0A4Z1ENG5_9HELO|nr:hypothetical protein BTUL_0082g00030 [Botrytis tulipae]
MTFKIHLPLSTIDTINQPPLYYLQIQDTLILSTGLFWTITYILYIRQAYRDESYGMPIIALCANIGWEIVYGFRLPFTLTEILVFVPWLIIDAFLVYTTMKFGPKQWNHAPLISQNLKAILGGGVGMMVVLHWAFAETHGDDMDAMFWSAFVLQIFLGISSVAQLMERGHTSGHSIEIWFCRFIGSASAILTYCWRYFHYPKDYTVVGTPLTTFLFVAAELADLYYPIVFKHLRKRNDKSKVL